mgnify:CR=1 FL=1
MIGEKVHGVYLPASAALHLAALRFEAPNILTALERMTVAAQRLKVLYVGCVTA